VAVGLHMVQLHSYWWLTWQMSNFPHLL
jgi:hypothetical protein